MSLRGIRSAIIVTVFIIALIALTVLTFPGSAVGPESIPQNIEPLDATNWDRSSDGFIDVNQSSSTQLAAGTAIPKAIRPSIISGPAPNDGYDASMSVPSDVVLASDAHIERTRIEGAPGDTVTVTVNLSYDGTLSSGDRLGTYLFVGGLNSGILDRILVVEDDPQDDQTVRVQINTFQIGRTQTARLTVSNSGYSIDASSGDNDAIESISRPQPPEVEDQLVDELPDPLPAGTYRVRTSTTETVRANDDDGGYLIFPDQADVANMYLSEETGTEEEFQTSVTINPLRPEPGESITFNASRSTSSTGSIFMYEWDFDNDGEVEARGETTAHTFEEAGEYLVGLRLTDDNGNDEVVGKTVVVNTPPDPAIDPTLATVTVGESVRFDASESTDEDGEITDFEWDIDDDSIFERSGTEIERTFNAAGTYNMTLLVTDDLNGTASTTAEIEVVAPTTTPMPTMTPTLTTTPTPTTTSTPTVTSTLTPTRTTTDRPIVRTTTTIEEESEAGGVPLIPMISLAALVVVGSGAWYRHASDRADGTGSTATDSISGDDQPPGGEATATSNSTRPSPDEDEGTPVVGRVEKVESPESIPSIANFEVGYDNITRQERIGTGGNADVSRSLVEDSDGTETIIALKEPRIEGTLSTDIVERFRREAETWAKLDDHDHIVGVLDYGTQPIPWIAMEYMNGGNLASALDERDFEEALWDAIKITEGVRHAHRRGVAHLDLKPANILFRETGPNTWDAPKVGDWGLAKMLLDHSHSIEGMSPHYAAPEQFDADTYGEPDDLTDIYQLGTVFYELFTGKKPFEGPPSAAMHSVLEGDVTPPTDIDPALPPRVDDVILTAMAQQKDDRYESVLYLRDELQAIYEEL